MKALGRITVVASLAAAVAMGAQPAQAAPYTIAATGWSGISATGSVFTSQACSADIANSALNGTDARIVDVSGFQNKSIVVNWNATQNGGSLGARMLASNCEIKLAAQNKASLAPGDWTLFVPSGTKWMLVEGSRAVQVSFTIRAI